MKKEQAGYGGTHLNSQHLESDGGEQVQDHSKVMTSLDYMYQKVKNKFKDPNIDSRAKEIH